MKPRNYSSESRLNAKKVGLGLNDPKTKYLAYNIDDHPPLVRHSPLVTCDGTALEQKEDFKYLGSWVDESQKDIRVRKGLAWKALNDMNRIWKSSMNPGLKKKLFSKCNASHKMYYG